MNKNHLKIADEDPKLKELKHGVNNDLAIVGSFLTLCHTLESDEIFKACLKNAEASLKKVAKKYC